MKRYIIITEFFDVLQMDKVTESDFINFDNSYILVIIDTLEGKEYEGSGVWKKIDIHDGESIITEE